jgi:hypothetical protein
MELVDEATLGRLMHGAGEVVTKRVLSRGARHAAAFITAVPISHQVIPSNSFAAALRLRLGMHQFPTTDCSPCPAVKADKHTICGELSDPIGLHSLMCNVGTGRTSRHNSIRDVLYETLKAAQFSTKKEVQYILDDGSKPADVLAERWEGAKAAAFDVTVVTPPAGRGVSKGQFRRGQAADAAEQAKMLKYAQACEGKGILFAPVAVEVYGAWGKSAQKVFARLGYALAARSGRPRCVEVRHMYERLSVALQSKNAAMILARAPS